MQEVNFDVMQETEPEVLTAWQITQRPGFIQVDPMAGEETADFLFTLDELAQDTGQPTAGIFGEVTYIVTPSNNPSSLLNRNDVALAVSRTLNKVL